MRRWGFFARCLVMLVTLSLLAPGCDSNNKEHATGQPFYLAPDGSDSNDGTQGNPWLSFNKAYATATPGAHVLVTGTPTMSYALQQIDAQPSKDSATRDIVFDAAPGADPHVGSVLIKAAHITIENLTLGNVGVYAPTSGTPAHDVTLLHNHMTRITVNGAHDIMVKNNNVASPVPVTTDSQNGSIGLNINTNVTYDGNWFHDFIDAVPGLHHIECQQIGSGVNLKIVDNTYGPNCDTHDLFMRSWGDTVNGGPHPLRNVLVQGNDFGPCRPGCYEFYPLDDLYTLGPTSLDVGWNTFEPGASPLATNWKGQITWHDNVEPTVSAFGCGYRANAKAKPASVWMNHNTFYGTAGVSCGTNAKVVASFPGAAVPPGGGKRPPVTRRSTTTTAAP